MAESPHFVRECPTCGRSLRIRVEYLGRQVMCQHCRGSFLARDASGRPAGEAGRSGLLERADELIHLAQRRLARPK